MERSTIFNGKTMERTTIFNGKTHYKWPFSIAMLVITRGYLNGIPSSATDSSSVSLSVAGAKASPSTGAKAGSSSWETHLMGPWDAEKTLKNHEKLGLFQKPICSMYGIFTIIYLHLGDF